MLDLLRPIYEKTAAYGHFGREEPEFTLGADRQGGAAARRGWPEEPLSCRPRGGGTQCFRVQSPGFPPPRE